MKKKRETYCGPQGEAGVTVQLDGGETRVCDPSTTPADFLKGRPEQEILSTLGALVNNDVVSLNYPLEVDSTLKFLSLEDSHGWRIYRQTASFLVAMAVRELYPEARFSVEHSLGNGFYCHFEFNGDGEIRPDQVEAIEKRVMELVAAKKPICRRKISFEQAVAHFEARGQDDKYNLLRFQNPSKVIIYACDDFFDLAHGPLAANTGSIHTLKLLHYPPGFVIQFPERKDPSKIFPFHDRPKLFQIFKEHKEWGRILGVQTVGQLNRIVADKKIDQLMMISEALHEKKVAAIADELLQRGKKAKWILIAGPSSAGKTTLSKRLTVQMRVNGLRPVTVSVDDYFVERDQTPRDARGGYDFEHIEAIDLELFNRHLQRLDEGGEVELPRFNFSKGSKEYHGDTLRIDEDQVVIIEGIHCLNPRLTEQLPVSHKVTLYVSALTQLNLDSNNRISTTDNRLLRRMVRDNQFRGHSALATLRMWPNVRRGEKKWIFPFQHEADLFFNSALDYELAVLKSIAEPLLAEVKPSEPEYAEARRLQQFLDRFLGVSADRVSPNSLLREYVGKSAFKY